MDWFPLFNSIRISLIAAVITFFIGIAAAKAVTSLKRGKFIADGILSLPLVLPPTVLGFFLLLVFGKNSSVGQALDSAGITVVFTWQGAAIAAAVPHRPALLPAPRLREAPTAADPAAAAAPTAAARTAVAAAPVAAVADPMAVVPAAAVVADVNLKII